MSDGFELYVIQPDLPFAVEDDAEANESDAMFWYRHAHFALRPIGYISDLFFSYLVDSCTIKLQV